MATDEDKTKLAKLLHDLEVPEMRIPERCSGLVKEFEQKYGAEVESEVLEEQVYENPYVVDKKLLEENERKLKELLAESKRAKKELAESLVVTVPDPKRPWRTQSSKEKLLRIDNDLKRHLEKASQAIAPIGDNEMRDLVRECQEETMNSPPVGADRLRETVDEARRNLPNFLYKKIQNSTATDILPTAHGKSSQLQTQSSGKHIPRPDTRRCFLRSLAELRNLRLLALEYAHVADGTGYALMALLPVLRRPHFRLQLICREDQIPGRADPARGAGGLGVPDTVWRRVSIACPDLYLLMAFFRIREYDNVRRFLSPSAPLREAHLQRGLELRRAGPASDLSCFVRHVAYRYGDTLVTLSIHEWRGVLFPLRRIVELLPGLVRLLYTGLVDERDLDDTLAVVACGVARKLKQLHIQVQDEESTRAGWAEALRSLRDKYKDIMALFDIKLCLQIYKN
ncbi:unnamed protein product [Colias eurytheme]|nr:unnamed protein product [Colias eurytheme]